MVRQAVSDVETRMQDATFKSIVCPQVCQKGEAKVRVGSVMGSEDAAALIGHGKHICGL